MITISCTSAERLYDHQTLRPDAAGLRAQKDSWAVDYQATSNVLQAAQSHGASHFVLLSAICVQKPLLEFQHAKLKFEEELMRAPNITHSIVRPTAFFKSVAGQVRRKCTTTLFVHHPLPLERACSPVVTDPSSSS